MKYEIFYILENADNLNKLKEETLSILDRVKKSYSEIYDNSKYFGKMNVKDKEKLVEQLDDITKITKDRIKLVKQLLARHPNEDETSQLNLILHRSELTLGKISSFESYIRSLNTVVGEASAGAETILRNIDTLLSPIGKGAAVVKGAKFLGNLASSLAQDTAIETTNKYIPKEIKTSIVDHTNSAIHYIGKSVSGLFS